MVALFGFSLSINQAAGLTAYTFGLLACVTAMFYTSSRGLFATGAAIDLYLVADIGWDLRWRLHESMICKAESLGLYGKRYLPQVYALALLALLAMLSLAHLLKQQAGRPGCQLTVAGMVLALVIWAVEVISLHSTDSFLFMSHGSFMVVAWGWMLAGALTSGGALWETARGR